MIQRKPGDTANMSTARVRAALCCLSAVWALFAGCAGPPAPAKASGAGTIRLGTFVEPSRITVLAGMQTSEPLVALGLDGRPVYRLAESSADDGDGKAFTIRLRPNIKFHTGEAVTAERVRELLLPKLQRTRAQVANVSVIDERSLMFVPTRPHAFKVADLSDYYVDDDSRPELRTGPFRITATSPVITLERFPGYHLGAPTVERIEIHRYPNHRAAWTAMMRGEINFLHEVNRDAMDFVAAGGDIRSYPMLRPFYFALIYNLRHPVLQSPEVRQALNEAIDRDEIVKNGMRGHGEPAEGPFWPYHWAYSPGRHPSSFNPEAARLRLDAAGLPMRPSLNGAMPSRFRFTCLVPGDDARFERIAMVLQRQLFAIGVDMQFEAHPATQAAGHLAKGNFDAVLFEMASRRGLSAALMWHSGIGVPTGYTAADRALDRMQTAASEVETRIAVSDVMRVMQTDPPAAFLVWPREARAADRSFEVPYQEDQDILGNLWQVRVAPPQSAASR